MAFDDFDKTQLKNIFDLCGPDNEGYIFTAYLSDKLAQQFNDQDLTALQDVLDPGRIGRISFDQFCHAVTALHGKEAGTNINIVKLGDDDSSDPETTYNEYDIPEDEISEMNNLEVIGESPQLSPIKSNEPAEAFKRNSSFRRSHRRVRSWNLRSNGAVEGMQFETACDETSSIASDYEDLSEKLDKLQDHMSRLEEDKSLQTRYECLKQENHQLNSRLHEMEEKLQDLSDRNEELKKAAKHKVEDLQREHELELQVMRSKLEVVTSDKDRLKSELDFTKKSAKESRSSLANMQSQSEILTKQIMETNEEYRRLNKRLSSQHDVHEFERTRLRHEVEELKQNLRSVEDENKRLKSELTEKEFDPTSARIKAHVDHLKAENNELKLNNEDLRDQLAQHLSEARLLVCTGEETSLADEMSSATRDEVMDALKKQEQINDQLRSYLERITLNILERNPEILEIK